MRGLDHQPRGWAFGVDLDAERQIAALVADSTGAAAQLIDACTADPAVTRALAFVRVNHVVTPEMLTVHGFSVQPYAYLIAPAGGANPAFDTWRAEDRLATADLLMRAYAEDRSLRPFARLGTLNDWLDYVDALTMRPGCGVFSPQATVVMREGGAVVGVALVTSIGQTTAHLAQLAVAPAVRGRGLARALVGAARVNADRVLRASRVSLLVSTANTPALRLYAREGFRHAGEFVAATRAVTTGHPLRSISTAPATGGDNARR